MRDHYSKWNGQPLENSWTRVCLRPYKPDVILKQHLYSRSLFCYFHQDAITAADIALWAALYPAFAKNPDVFSSHQHILHWFQGLTQQAAFQDAVSKVVGDKGAAGFKDSVLAQPIVAPAKETRPSSTSSTQGSQQSNSEVYFHIFIFSLPKTL